MIFCSFFSRLRERREAVRERPEELFVKYFCTSVTAYG